MAPGLRMQPRANGRVLEFGDFRLDVVAGLLTSKSGGRPVPLTPRVYDTLRFLVEHPNELLDKRTLMQAVWPNLVVEENNLDQTISALRQALGERRGENRYIATVRGRGYRFVAPVRIHDGSAEPAPLVRTRSRLTGYLLAALVLVAAGATWWWSRQPAQSAAQHDTPSLAVLPFRPLTATDRSESLELGMAETLISGLNGEGLAVQPLSAVRRYGGAEQDALLAGRELGVSAVLEGYIQRDGDRLRVSARLLDVASGRQLWSGSYDEPFTDIFTVQDTIAGRVRAALLPEMGARQSTLPRHTTDPEAYQLYINGRFYREMSAEAGLRRAIEYFEQAIARDPDFAAAYAGLADAHSTLAIFGAEPPREAFPRAQQAVARALELAPNLGAAHAARGHIRFVYEHDWAGAEADLLRAIELEPGYASAHQFLGLLYAELGRFEEGLHHMRHATALEPSRPMLSAVLGMVLVYQRRYDEAIAQLHKTLEMDPDLPTAHTYLAMAYARRGDYEEAERHLAKVRTPTPGSFGYRGQIHALKGQRLEALREIEKLKALSRERFVPSYDIATIYAALGDVDQAFIWLERGFDDGSTLIPWLPWDEVFDGLRNDPRYRALTTRLSLGPKSAAR